MKKKLPIILLGVILACVLVFGFLYANNDIGKTANSLEADIRQSQKILDDWIVDGSISDTMAAFISYPQDKTDHTFSVYVNRPGLSFGYFFRGGGDIVEVDDYIAEFVVEGNNERAFISMNTQNIVRLEVDTAPDSFEMDYDKLADAITEKTKVVLPVDLAGVVCDYDKIFAAVESKKHLFSPVNDIQKAYGRVIVLADAAHAFGAKWHGKMCGEIADFTSFSFHAVKNLTTAEGGALTWRNHDGVDNESLYKQFQLLSLHGQNKDALAKTRLGAWEYDIVAPYYKCNMTDVMAGIGLAQLKRYPEMLYRRRQIIERYNEGLRGCDVQVLDHFGDDHSSSGHLYLVRLLGEDVEYRNAVIERMAERGIACNVHYKPLPMMTAYKNLGFDIVDYPNAYNQYHNEITLPLHTSLTNEDVEYVISNFVDIITQ